MNPFIYLTSQKTPQKVFLQSMSLPYFLFTLLLLYWNCLSMTSMFPSPLYISSHRSISHRWLLFLSRNSLSYQIITFSWFSLYPTSHSSQSLLVHLPLNFYIRIPKAKSHCMLLSVSVSLFGASAALSSWLITLVPWI